MATVHGDALHMGPEGDHWQYRPSSKTYDLTRGAKAKPLMVGTTRGADNTKIAIDPQSTALVIVDMQNFFLHPRCRDHPTGLAAVEPTLRVIESCRRAGIQVVWLNWGLTDADLAAMPAAVVTGFARQMLLQSKPTGLGVDLGDGGGRTLVKGAWNAQVYAPLAAAVRPEDVKCDKTRMSGLWSPHEQLSVYLREKDIIKKTLLFAGVNTDQCVLGTLADAYNQGWDCVAVDDCCATTTPGAHETTMVNVANCYGFVIDSDTFASGVESFCE